MNKKHAFIGLVVVCLLVCALVWAWQARKDKKVSQVPVQAGLEENGAAALDTAPVIERTCSVPEMRDYMQYGVFYTYVYEDGQGKEIMSLTVDEAACEVHEREKAKKDVNGTGQAGSQASGQ